MKIYHVVWTLQFGGIETMTVNIANEQAAAGHDVHFVVINDEVSPRLRSMLSPAVKFHAVGRRPRSRNPLPVIRLWAVLASSRGGVIHFHGVNMPSLVPGFIGGKRFVTHHTSCRPELALYFRPGMRLFAISNEVAADIRRITGLDARVVMNGILSDRFSVRDSRPAATPLRILQLGRVSFDIKGQDLTVAALRRLRSEGVDAVVDFVGDGSDASRLENMIASGGLRDYARVLGSRPQEWLWQHLADYDVLVQPSRIEGFGLTVAEAMAAGVPVAVSNLPALVEVVDNGRFGDIFRLDDDADFAAAILRAAGRCGNPDSTSAAVAYVRRTFDVRRTAADYLSEYIR